MLRKNSASGCPTNDFLGSGRHFLSPRFGCLRRKASFSTPTGYFNSCPRNPDHIFNGTRSYNIRDSMSKGRMNFIARTERSLAAAYQRSKTHCARVRHLNCAIGNVVVVMVTFVAEARAVNTKGRKIKEKKNRIPKSCLRSTVWARFQKGHGQK